MGVTRTTNRSRVGLFLTLVGLEVEPDSVPDHAVAVAKQAEYGKLPSLPKELSGRVKKITDAETHSWKANLEAGKPFSIVEDDRKSLNEFMKKILPDIADRARNNQQLGDIRLHVKRTTRVIDAGVRLPEHDELEKLVKQAALEQSIDLSKFRFTYRSHSFSEDIHSSVEITVHRTPRLGKSDYLGETSLTEFFLPRFSVLSEAARERITWLSTGFIAQYKTGRGENKVLSIAVAQTRSSGPDLLVKEVRDLVLAAFTKQLPGPEAARQARRILGESVHIKTYRGNREWFAAVLVDVVGTGEVSSVRREEWEEQARSTRMASRAASALAGNESAPDPVSNHAAAAGQTEDPGLTWLPRELSGRARKRTDAEIESWKGGLEAGVSFVIVEGARESLNKFIKKFLDDIADRARNNQQLGDIRLHVTKRIYRVDYGDRGPEHEVLEELVRQEALKRSIDLSEFRFTYVTHRSNSSDRSVGITVHETPERGKSHYLEETSLTEFLLRGFDVLSEAARERITWLSMGFIRRREHEDGNKILSIAMTRSPNNDADLVMRVVRDLVVAAFAEQLPGPEAEREAHAILRKSVRITLYRAGQGEYSTAVLVDVVGKGEVSSVRREERAEQALSTRMASRAASALAGNESAPDPVSN
ncbi:hypothetical protein, partial [Amycolatopsis decaplanina]